MCLAISRPLPLNLDVYDIGNLFDNNNLIKILVYCERLISNCIRVGKYLRIKY